MALLTCLYKLKQIERNAAELYHFLYLKLASRDEAAGDLFLSLSEEERVHEKEVENIMNLYHETAGSFAEKAGSGEDLDRVLKMIDEIKKNITENIESLSPFDIARMIYDLESFLEGRHQDYYVEVIDDRLKVFFSTLIRGDQGHLDKLRAFINDCMI